MEMPVYERDWLMNRRRDLSCFMYCNSEFSYMLNTEFEENFQGPNFP